VCRRKKKEGKKSAEGDRKGKKGKQAAEFEPEFDELVEEVPKYTEEELILLQR